jgi:hypothetical protein
VTSTVILCCQKITRWIGTVIHIDSEYISCMSYRSFCRYQPILPWNLKINCSPQFSGKCPFCLREATGIVAGLAHRSAFMRARMYQQPFCMG